MIKALQGEGRTSVVAGVGHIERFEDGEELDDNPMKIRMKLGGRGTQKGENVQQTML